MPLKLLITVATCVLLAHANPQALPVADDTESFITKEAAKELRNKLSSSFEQQDDYDEILKDIIRGLREKPKSDQQQIFYEKKYFDYLPNEIVDSDDETSEDLTHESVNPDSKAHESSESVRAKREAPARKKRFYQPGFQIFSQPLHHFSPIPQVSFYFPTDLFSDFPPPITAYNNVPRTYNYPQQVFNTGNLHYNPGNPNQNPNARFQPPGNFYLPPVTTTPPPPPRGYLPASHQTSNLPHPPDNNVDPFENRVGGFEGNEKGPVFEVRPIRPDNYQFINNEIGSKGGSDYGRRTNMPTTTFSPFNFDLESFGKDSKEVEIEYAPEIEEEVSTTTRASIRRPTKKNKNQQQSGRQKKSDSESSTTTTERTNISQQDLSVTNNSKPNKPLSACVEAIVNCCSRYDEIVRLPCFEVHNCNGAFFGRSPCTKEIQQAAFKEVEKYSEAKRR